MKRRIRLPLTLVGPTLHPFFRATLNPRTPIGIQRRLHDAAARLQPLPNGTTVERITLGGRPAERIANRAPGPHALLHLHGGGFTLGSATTHRSLAGYLARGTGCPVYLPEYRLAPEHPYPAALDDAVDAFLELVDRHGYLPQQIGVVGDSAGGGLAVATALRLRDEHGIAPAALGLISPWVDPSERAGRPRDLVVSDAWGRSAAAAYLGDGDPADPGYAPLHGDLTELPPTLVQVGTTELLYSQNLTLAERLRAAGVEVTLDERPRLWHDAQLQAGLVREAAAAVADMSAFLRAELGRTDRPNRSTDKAV